VNFAQRDALNAPDLKVGPTYWPTRARP